MLDYCVTPEGDFSDFCTRVRRLLPEHGHLPEAKVLPWKWAGSWAAATNDMKKTPTKTPTKTQKLPPKSIKTPTEERNKG